MGRWRVPDKVLLPAEPDLSPSAFEYNGRLADGDQVMAYVALHDGPVAPRGVVFTRYTAVVFRFDADGALRTVDFASTGGPDDGEAWRNARALLTDIVRPVLAEGWRSGDISVRPFYVVVDGLHTGLIYRTAGDDEGDDEYGPEEVRLVPFDKIFYRPWDSGAYDT